MVEICGVKYLEGISKKSGKPYTAYSVHFTESGENSGYEGFITGNAFIPLQVLNGRKPAVGDKVDILYDKNGFLQRVEFLA